MPNFTAGLIVALYRWTGGRIGGRMPAGPVLLLTTTGRRSGQPRTVPVNYFEADGTLYIVASNGGQPRHPAWYLNLVANPTVRIERGRAAQTARATPARGEQRARLWERLVAQAPLYARYQAGTTREIPIVVLEPEG